MNKDNPQIINNGNTSAAFNGKMIKPMVALISRIFQLSPAMINSDLMMLTREQRDYPYAHGA